jgi:hypothetical protein
MIIVSPESIPGINIDVGRLDSPVGMGGSISNTDPMPGISPHVAAQFPSFVAEDHPRFIEFMEAYYRWMESNGQTLHESMRVRENQDIDTASDEYVEHFFNEFLTIIPRNILANKATVLKNIKQFYGAKGTEKSFKFLFRILFNSDSYLYYPKDDILRTSDGKWIQNKTVRVTNVVGDIKKLRAQKIRGLTNNSSAFVERLYGINFGNYSAHELVLNRASITGKFLPGETLVSEDGTIRATISPIPETIRIVKPGKNYKIGDRFAIDYIGKGAIIRVAEVDDEGGITRFYIQEYGVGYSTARPPKNIKCINEEHLLGDSVAEVTLVLGSTTNYPGYFRNEDGQLSTTKYIHDGYYYQQFSYVTNTEESFDKYKDIMNKAVHPLGFKHFGSVAIETQVDAGIKLPVGSMMIHIITNNGVTTDATLDTKTEIIHPNTIRTDNQLGASYDSILRDKFNYKPFVKYDANTEFDGANSNHFGTGLDNRLASTPVSTFETQHIGTNKPIDLESNRLRPIKLQSDAVIIQSPDRIQVVVLHERNVITATEGETVAAEFAVTNTTDANYTWILKKDGIEIARGEQSSGDVSVDVIASAGRLALFVIDDLGRTYKSDNVGIKIVE